MNRLNVTKPIESSSRETIHTCPQCGGVVATSWQKYRFSYGKDVAQTELEVEVPVRDCEECEESFLDWEAHEIQHGAVCEHLGVLSPKQVKDIRAKYGMSRSAFSELTGFGEASLSRWEKGSHIQNLANDRYLRLLRDPETVDELRLIDSLEAPLKVATDGTIANFPNLKSSIASSRSSFRLRRSS